MGKKMSQELRERLNILESSMQETDTVYSPVVTSEAETQTSNEEKFIQRIKDKKEAKETLKESYNTFEENVKTQLLESAIYGIVKKAVGETTMNVYSESTRALAKSVIHGFIEEQGGADQMLREMGHKSQFLAEMSMLITEMADDVMEDADPENPDSLTVDSKEELDFYENIEGDEDVEDIADIIKQRATRANDAFNAKIIADKEDIKELQLKSKEYIDNIHTGDAATDEEIKQEATTQLNRKVYNIKHNSKSIYEQLTLNLSSFVIANEATRNEYVVEGKLDVSAVQEKVDVLYTFLETVNTLKLAKIDENFISEFISVK